METLEKCPQCGGKMIHNVFLNAEKTRGVHRCPEKAGGCGYEKRYEPGPPPKPPLPHVP